MKEGGREEGGREGGKKRKRREECKDGRERFSSG